jgi:hypothetical protein
MPSSSRSSSFGIAATPAQCVLHQIGEHRRRGLAYRAAAPLEAHLLDDIAVPEPHRDGDFVAAERILAFRRRIRIREQPVVSRALVVIEDHLSVHLLELTH